MKSPKPYSKMTPAEYVKARSNIRRKRVVIDSQSFIIEDMLRLNAVNSSLEIYMKNTERARSYIEYIQKHNPNILHYITENKKEICLKISINL